MRARACEKGWVCRPGRLLLTVLLLTTVCGSSPASSAESGRLVPLYSWWSSDHQDHLCTSDPTWAGSTGKVKDTYRFYRREGYLYSPDGTQPPGTVPLYRWWNPSRKDYFTTSNPDWKGGPRQARSGYRFVRLEGYVLSEPGKGRRPLKSYWSPARSDNVATADPAWEQEKRRAPDYRHFRVDGYLLDRAAEAPILTAPGDVEPSSDEDCVVIVTITGKFSQFTDTVGVFRAESGGPGEFLYKRPTRTVRDHRRGREATPTRQVRLTLASGEYYFVPSGGGKDDVGYFGVIHKPRNSGFTCEGGNAGRISFSAEYTEY